jgi:hypothetical protein
MLSFVIGSFPKVVIMQSKLFRDGRQALSGRRFSIRARYFDPIGDNVVQNFRFDAVELV